MVVKVKTLREFAFETVFQELISEFGVIFRKQQNKSSSNATIETDDSQRPLMVPADAADDELSDDCYVLTKAARDKALDDLRLKLDENLIGPYSTQRKRIVDRFIEDHNNRNPSEVDYNLCLAFLNCLLDKSFTSFDLTGEERKSDGHFINYRRETKEVRHPFAYLNPSELLQVISQQSPDLESLGLCFSTCGLDGGDIIEPLVTTLVPTLCAYFKTFKCLLRLNLTCHRSSIDFLSFFTSLGESCPKLIRLDLSGDSSFSLKHLSALILGKKHGLLPQQLVDQFDASDSLVAHLQFTPQSVTPICSSLQQLNVNCKGVLFHKHEVAFILRHFPKLQTFTAFITYSIAEAVHLLHKQQQEQNSTKEATNTYQQSSEELGLIEWTVNAPFHGQLNNLIKLDSIQYNSRIHIEAMAALCPLLKEVKFCPFFLHLRHRRSSKMHNESPNFQDFLLPEQLRSLLSLNSSCWSNVESIQFSDVPANYRCVILDCLHGDQLRSLGLLGCKDIDPIVELFPIKRLEILNMYGDLTPIADAAALAKRVPSAILSDCGNTFLPNLKELNITCTCLDYWSRLFECHRPSLTKLKLSCFHIGLSSMSPFNWSDAPDLWPNLKELGLLNTRECTTLDPLRSITPHLKEFQKLEKLLVVPIDFRRELRTRNPKSLLGALIQLPDHALPVGLRVENVNYPYICFHHHPSLQE